MFMDIDKIFQSKIFRVVILSILVLMVILLILKIGMFIGAKRAGFTRGWGDNYHQNFGGPKGGFMAGFGDKDFMQANGISGQIIKIDGTTITVSGRDNVEKIISTDDKTIIRNLDKTIKVSDLKVDDFIVVIGEPNDAGQIEAKFIRVMPQMPEGMPMLFKEKM